MQHPLAYLDNTYYSLLALPESADRAAIDSAYRDKMTLLAQYPSRGIGHDQFRAYQQQVQQAYDTLANAHQRHQYDRQLADWRAKAPQRTKQATRQRWQRRAFQVAMVLLGGALGWVARPWVMHSVTLTVGVWLGGAVLGWWAVMRLRQQQ